MYELRISSGLHRGATLPLGEDSYLVGASDDADVVLVDDSIKPRHAVLSRTESGWLLSAENGSLFAADSNLRQTLIDLMPGDFVRLGDIWITIVHQDAPWKAHPANPVDVEFEPEPSAAPVMETSAAVDAPPSAPDLPIASASRFRKRSMLALPVVAVVVLSAAAAAYALSPKSSQSDAAPKYGIQAGSGPMALQDKTRGKQAGAAAGAASSKVNATAATGTALTPDALRKAFEKRLADADLLKRFDLTLDEKAWTMQANLDDEETARFERILKGFMDQHRIAFPVNARIVTAEAMLPFKIRQVISGANASVVTQEGQRLYVGEEYRGVRVVAIRDNHLTFAGKRKIEMNW